MKRPNTMHRIYAGFLIQIGVLAFCSAPLHAQTDTVQFGFVGEAQLSSASVLFGQYPNGAPYTPAPGYGTAQIALVNEGIFNNSGLTTGEFVNIQSLNLQPGPVTLPFPFIVFNLGASNLQLWATRIRGGNHGALTGLDAHDAAVISFDVEGYVLDSNNATGKQQFFCTVSLTFAGETVAQVLKSITNSTFSGTISLTAPPRHP